ncbi:hypothetical protein B7463_g6515, partial [Scytalidium lignicola]
MVMVTITKASVAPSVNTTVVCNHLWQKYPNYFAWDPFGPYALESIAKASVYTDINTVYYNAKNSQFRAACAFFPGNAQQVSDVVMELNKYPDVQFALKSGGHQPAPGFSATDGGVIISFEPNLASTVRTADGSHFVIGMGARWGDVYEVTSKTKQVVVGGRLAHIGVGGLTLGGGLSYYSAQYGLACDNIDNFEVVLANGSITDANRTSHPDLWWSLRGGGNQFAIVTHITTQAHPAGIDGQVWGGVRAYAPEHRTALFHAITNFVREYPDPKAAVIPTFQFSPPGNLLNVTTNLMLFFFYDGPDPSDAFAEFDAIPSLTDDTQARTYLSMAQEVGGANTTGFGNSFRVNTVPNLPEDQMVKFFEKYYDTTYSQSLNDNLTNLDVQLMGFDPQPLSVRIQKASQAQGGNALGLDPANGDRVWIENDFMWLNSLCDDSCPEYSREVSDQLLAYQKATYPGVPPTNYQSGDIEFTNYNPIFMNDAAPYQDVYASYGWKNLAKLKAVKAVYDPNGFFTNRQGGFKLSL